MISPAFAACRSTVPARVGQDDAVAHFHFVSTWLLEAPPEPVFDALHDYRSWPQWWPGVEHARELQPTGADGLGGVASYVFRSATGYAIRFEASATRLERPWLLAGSVSGSLAGEGTWRLFRQPGDVTAAVYDWRVRTTTPLFGVAAVALRPLLARNHDALMRDGAAGLARQLGVELLLCS